MAASREGLVLNVTEKSTPETDLVKVNRKSWKYKKQVRMHKAKGGRDLYGPGRQQQPVARSSPAAAGSTLKGYTLKQSNEPDNLASKLVPERVLSHMTHTPRQPPSKTRQLQNVKGIAKNSKGHAIFPEVSREASDHGTAEDMRPDHQAGNGKPSGGSKACHSARGGTPDSDQMVGASDDEETDVRSAVALAMTKEASLKLDAPNADSDEDEGTGVVEFWDEEDKPSVPRHKRQKKQHAKQPISTNRKVAAGGVSYPTATTLAHASTDVPQEQHADLFGEVDTTSFEGLGLAQQLAQHLEDINFVTPTVIQQAAIPPLLAGHDALVNAPTGSGKTLCYLAPIVNYLQGISPRINRRDGTFAIIVSPTRELALQIYSILSLVLRRYHWMVGGAILGGENRNHEKQRLRKGVNVLVATPGRLLDHLTNSKSFKTDDLRWLVLDEADRLLDLGFEKKLGEIVGMLDKRLAEAGNERRQTVLLSATLHPQLSTLATLSLKDPKSIGFRSSSVAGNIVIADDNAPAEEENTASISGLGAQTSQKFDIPKQLKQRYVEVPCKLRLTALAALLKSRCNTRKDAKVVVFVSTCDAVEFLCSCLTEVYTHLYGEPLLSCSVFKMHGLMPQGERTASFVSFTSCRSGVLVATDVAARGVDFPAVTTIVQFDPPGEPSEYVHRVGRTARMGQKGDSLLFVMPHERPYVDALQTQGVIMNEERLLPLMDWLLPEDFKGKASGSKGRTLESHEGAFRFQRDFMSAIDGDKQLRQMAMDAFRSFVRAYSTHSADLKSIFHIKKLHLGHVAHAFALKESPSLIGSSSSRAEMKRRKANAALEKNKKFNKFNNRF